MGRKDTTTITFECDWKCGEIRDVVDRTSLNHANVPMGWEKIYREPSGYMHTDADSVKVPYILCPKCFRLFTICAQANTPKGVRFRQYVEAFWEAEQVLASKCIDVKIEGGGGGGWPGGGGAAVPDGTTYSVSGGIHGPGNSCGMPGCNLPPGHGHGGGGGGHR